MNIHTARDTLYILGSVQELGKGVFFSGSLDSPALEEMLDRVTVHVPEICGEGCYEVEADTSVGTLDPAFCIRKWLGIGYPTIIWHHGNSETPFDFSPKARNSFNAVFGPEDRYPEANLIVQRAAFHAGGAIQYAAKVHDLENLVAMMAASVKLAEHLTAYAKGITGERVIFAGISLGGFAANIHRAYFNSADSYIPLLAGAAFDDLFLGSKYSKLTAQQALDAPEKMKSVLNFEEDFRKISDKNVFPLLAKHDRFVRNDIQRAAYEGHPVATVDMGHVTAAMAGDVLRKHVMKALDN